ncbi:MAG: class I SAM-dependent methyltransferase [Candidatus Daviesbacteria bacterium]|nr:class I SAM-dependent methyltransferase [Candidatus Daviesbacteria bacterium]
MDITLIISGGILIGCIIGLSWFAGSDAPFVPTRMEGVRKILKLAGVKKGKKFYELGSGDGRVVYEAARLGAKALGVEQSWLRILYSRYKALRLGLQKAKFSHGNIFSKSYSDADVIYIYLLHKGVKKLEEKLYKETKKGTVVITQTYHFPKWRPSKKAGDFWIYTR